MFEEIGPREPGPTSGLRLIDAHAVTEIFQGAQSIDHEQFRDEIDTVLDQSIEPRA